VAWWLMAKVLDESMGLGFEVVVAHQRFIETMGDARR